jgi:hypothetical protein
MNYLYSRLEWEADFEQNTPERKAFAEHLKLVAKALHDIEWVDSCDYGPGDENAAILACLKSAPAYRSGNMTLSSPEMASAMQQLKDRIANEPGFALSLLTSAGIANADGTLAEAYGGSAPAGAAGG